MAFAQCKTYSGLDAHGKPLDIMLVDIMNINNGTFIEIGAYDGLNFSNTKLLEECYGWTGLLIEPSANIFKTLQKNRPQAKCFQCAVGAFEEDNTYAYGDFEGHTMSSLTNRLNRPANQQVLIRSLQSILDECNLTHINFLSLDTEGYELHILQGIDYTKTTFDYLLIEIYIDQYNEIIQLLDNNGYEMITCLSNYNKQDNPGWDGTHNDYLFKRRSL